MQVNPRRSERNTVPHSGHRGWAMSSRASMALTLCHAGPWRQLSSRAHHSNRSVCMCSNPLRASQAMLALLRGSTLQ